MKYILFVITIFTSTAPLFSSEKPAITYIEYIAQYNNSPTLKNALYAVGKALVDNIPVDRVNRDLGTQFTTVRRAAELLQRENRDIQHNGDNGFNNCTIDFDALEQKQKERSSWCRCGRKPKTS